VALVIYALIPEQNIARLFVAAILPHNLAALAYMAAISLHVRLHPRAERRRPRRPWRARCAALGGVCPVLAIFLAVVGGIYLGICSPTEAPAIGAAGTGLAAIANGRMTRAGLKEAILSTASSTAMIFLIILCAAVYNAFLALTQLPQEAARYVVEAGFSPWLVL